MKTIPKEIDFNRLFIGAKYSVWASTKVSIGVVFLLSFVFMQQSALFDFIGLLFAALFTLVLFGGFITFIIALTIGAPIAMVLIKLDLIDELITAVIGLLLVIFFFILNGYKEAYLPIYSIYTFFCAGAFMHGYIKGE